MNIGNSTKEKKKLTVILIVPKPLIRHVAHPALPATRHLWRSVGGHPGPDLDAGAVRGVAHADVVHVHVLHHVHLAAVLAQAADRDAVGAVAREALDENVGGVGLEGDAVFFSRYLLLMALSLMVIVERVSRLTVVVVDPGVLDDDVVATEGIPPIRVLPGRQGRQSP